MADTLALIIVSLALSAGVSSFFGANKKTLLILCSSSFAASIINLMAFNGFGKYHRAIFLGPLAEEVCRSLAILILGKLVLMRPNRWVAGLGFWSLEGFSKCIRFLDKIVGSPPSSEQIAVWGGAVFGSAMVHVLIASIVLSNWRRSPVLAFLLGLGMHVCHNGFVAYVAARVSLNEAIWLEGWTLIYVILCVTCFRRYDEQVRAASHDASAG